MKIVAEAMELSINRDAALGEPLADFGVAESVSYIPAHGRSDGVVGECAAREGATRASCEAPTATRASEPLATELGSSIPGHDFRVAPRASHRYPPTALLENRGHCQPATLEPPPRRIS